MKTIVVSALIPMTRLFFRSRERKLGPAIIVVALILFSCGGGGGGGDSNSVPPAQSSTVPQGAIWTAQAINIPTTPSGYAAVVGFALAVTLDPSSHDQALVEVDYMRLIERDLTSGVEIEVAAEEYDDGPRALEANEGGLYIRIPKWFPPGDAHTPVTNAEIRDGLLIIDVAKTPDKIVHWWTNRATAGPNHRYYVEVKIRVTGQAALQLGSDWWRNLTIGYNYYDATCDTSNNCEAWASNWIVDTKGSFVVRKVPVG